MIRVGIGQDSHWLVKGRGELMLGGVVVSVEHYFKADSDGDVIIHALCNALSTAIGGGSLDTWAGEINKKGVVDSKEYLKVIVKKVEEQGYKINSVAVMVEAREPRMEEYRNKMQESLARELNINTNQVGMAFTTGEGLTSFGRGKGILAWSSVVIDK
ncbi:MAG: 2-C-methyl-D-erythritol 2,4-cyclodiphosphate synthase [Candidatus Beckwithbacteria bacterium]